MEKDLFLSEVERRFLQLFKVSKSGHPIPPVERHRLQGFMQAGVFMELCNRRELNEIMERTHLEIFRKTIEQRKVDAPVSWIYEETDYRPYESPAYERRT